MKNVIYKIRNVIDGKFYVGSTVDSRKRFWAHRKALRLGNHVCVYLQRAWNKYGEECFKFEVVEQLDSKEALYPAEQKWLDEHFGKDYCYNVAAHADSPMRDASPEMRALLAERTKAWLERNGHPRQGHKCTPEELAYMGEQRKGKAAGEDHYRYGKGVSEEIRKKIGDTQRGVAKGPGRKVSAEGAAKIRAAAEAGHYSHWEGRTHSEESILKMSKPILAILPDRSERVFAGLSQMKDELGVALPTIIRACRSGKPIKCGNCAGWVLSYAEGEKNVTPEIPEEYLSYPRSRTEAKAAGAQFYFTGVACDRGHIAPRKTKGCCVECMREDWKKQNAAKKRGEPPTLDT